MSARHIRELDGLRAMAAFAVIAFHTRVPGFSGGFLGVDVFFVLSGFLTASVAMSGRYSFGTFMLRRLRRIWPLLLFVTAVVAVYLVTTGRPNPARILPGAVFLGNLTTVHVIGGGRMNHAWSLATEMQFYALVAALALGFDRAVFRRICMALFLATTAGRVGLGLGGDWLVAYYSPLTHSSGLFLGAVLATLPLERLPRPRIVFALAAALCLAAFGLAEYRTATALALWITVVEVAGAGMIAAAVAGGAAMLGGRQLGRLGVLSYGIYLWHYPIAIVLRKECDPVTAFLMTAAIATLLAALTHRLVEQPFRAAGGHGPGRALRVQHG